ncbi:sensor domain-containing diguanylate cyclase [Halobacillus sp. A5]|uniref:sensor domain-containing diguanylate cyclase n=1 Tax=Halobacillus sp. A5 TaxID=2880263 RepID=UPI0020A63CB7|nr:sensor domain-containing diguanylate cyclase [Halobacillus sp. A5]MCP3027378.1 sensor domain-containing diguanylate cyclase [Halobacillus sp. A5]
MKYNMYQQMIEDMMEALEMEAILIQKAADQYICSFVSRLAAEKFHKVLSINTLLEDSEEFKVIIQSVQRVDDIKQNNQRFFHPLLNENYLIHSIIGLDQDAVSYLIVFQASEFSSSPNDKKKELKDIEERYLERAKVSKDAVFLHDRNDRIVFVNKAAVRLLKAEREDDLLGKDIVSLFHSEPAEHIRARLRGLFAGTFVSGPLERCFKGYDGSLLFVQMHGGVMNFQGDYAIQTICKDVTNQRTKDQQLKEMIYIDPLTEVYNRRYFLKQLVNSIHSEGSLPHFAVFYMDMDSLKEINDTYGHHIGDQVLIIFSNRVRNVLREEDLFARIGGDEFAVLLPHVDTEKSAVEIAERIVTHISQTASVDGITLQLSVSIGISLYPLHGYTESELLNHADEALYKVKSKDKNGVRIFSREGQPNER